MVDYDSPKDVGFQGVVGVDYEVAGVDYFSC